MQSVINVALGNRIRFLRQQRNWSIEFLALEAGINRNYLSDLERGTRNPTVLVLEKIANAFNISLELLFQDVE